jgi:hypothetical protein
MTAAQKTENIGDFGEASGPESGRAVVIPLADGASAHVAEGALELRDEAGRLLIRYDRGSAEIASPSGDLKLSAPSGRVVIQSGTDVSIEAARDVAHRAGRRMDIAAGRPGATPQLRIDPRHTQVTTEALDVSARKSRLATEHATFLARTIVTTASSIATTAERYELSAARLVEKARDAFRTVRGLAETRVGRARTLVEGQYSLHSDRTVMISKQETSLDGEKILLG